MHARRTVAALAALTTIGLVGSAQAAWGAPGSGGNSGPGSGTRVVQSNIVSDIPGMATLTDPLLVNPWGMSFLPTSPLWTSNQGTGTASLFSGAPPAVPPAIVPLVVTIHGGPPTGQVSNTTTGFPVTGSLGTGTARFIFATLGGAISAWTPAAEATDSVVVANPPGASYTGLTMINTPSGPELLAANFAQRRIDVFDSSFKLLDTPGLFRGINIPKGFAPFNVQNEGGLLYVTYAKQDADAHDDVAGPGKGFVDVFDTGGKLVGRLQHGGFMNSPWGVTQAPADGGQFSGDILVGMFGSGKIAAFDPVRGKFDGLLRNQDGSPVKIDGLWALTFGNGAANADPKTLYFTAGPNDESNGLFGSLTLHQRMVNDDDGRPGHDDDDHGKHDHDDDDDRVDDDAVWN